MFTEQLSRESRHELVFIEYHGRRAFSVIVAEHWDHSKKPWFKPGYRATGVCPQFYDFEFSKTFGHVYFHNSGGGGELQIVLNECVKKKKLCDFWAADHMPLFRYGGNARKTKLIRLKDREWERLGYRRLRNPRLLSNGSRDPFVDACDQQTYYCDICKDHLPDEVWNFCKHVSWCELCGVIVYVKDHTPIDGGKPVVHTKEELESIA